MTSTSKHPARLSRVAGASSQHAMLEAALAHHQAGRLESARDLYQQVLQCEPDHPRGLYLLGALYFQSGQVAQAVQLIRRAVEIDPGHVEFHLGLGIGLQTQGDMLGANASYRAALAIDPACAMAQNNLGSTWSVMGALDAARQAYRSALALDPDYDVAHSNHLFHWHYENGAAPPAYLREAQAFGARVAARAQPFAHPRTDPESGRLRIGFVSGDLYSHPVAYFLENVLRHMKRERYELLAYPTTTRGDATTARLQAQFDGWHGLAGMSDAAAAARIHADGVHILVDLAGHTQDNRLPVFAWKPAPVQVTWLGYFASTGMSEIDYILADSRVLPLGEVSHFVERAWYLPDCYLCFTPPTDDVEPGPLPMLSRGYPTFGCFNNLLKMGDDVVALWARLLQALPQSRLLLMAKELHYPAARQATHRRFEAHGIAAQRIELAGPVPRTDYLAAYRRVDIALDPFPYPGGTTTAEALWMGVPVLNLRGERFLSHAGASLLCTVGLEAWVAADPQDYVAKARRFAADPAGLAVLRQGLRARLTASPLCDARRFAAHLGMAFDGMWRRYRNGHQVV